MELSKLIDPSILKPLLGTSQCFHRSHNNGDRHDRHIFQLFQRQLKKHSGQNFLPEKQVLFLQMGYTTMRYTKRLLDAKVAGVRCFEDMKPLLPDRLARLFEILKFFTPANMEKVEPDFSFCGIVFVEQRYVAYVLNVGSRLHFFFFFF